MINRHIVIDVRMIECSGIGVYLQNLLPRIVAMAQGWQFILLGDTIELRKYDWVQKSTVKLVHCTAPIYSIVEQWQFRQLIPSGVELFWSPHYNIPLMYRGKLLVTVHDVFHLAMPELISGLHKRFYASAMFRAVCSKANRVIVPSAFTQRELVRLLDYSDAQVIPNGVDDIWFEGTSGAAVRPSPYFIYVGNVKPHKNLKTLLQAFEKIMHLIPQDLVIVGKREGFITGDNAVLRQAEDLGNRVVFTGLLPDDLLRQYVAQATAMVFPSLYEGFGLPPLEAMACGCPIIASTAASIPEVCGEAAMYVNPLNADDITGCMIKLAERPDVRQDLIIRGKVQAQNFSWDQCAQATFHVINTLLG